MGNAGSSCCCCSKRERSVEDLLDGTLEDKLLGKREDDDVEATTAEEEAWRQRREQLRDEADMSMKSIDDDENGSFENDSREADMEHASLIWDLSDRNTVRAVHKEAENLVEDEEDEEAFGSAKEDANDDEDDDQETKEHVAEGEEFNLDRLTQLSARSADDSYASMQDSFRGEDTRVFRDTELDRATEVSDTFLALSSPSSLRGTVANNSFLVDDDDVQQQQEQQEHQEQQQKEEHDNGDQAEENSSEKRRSSLSWSSHRRSSKKKSRSRSRRK
ncbi:unnamed protein product [Phytophthora lilii]|uniref:Unnamed protein product n=1 Tax=Phytophthora lilii TaxID=2077276 RepID=A0A9W6U1P6_9STRA|nr:unnamed protein product [Phytophthora lilii]